MRTLTSHTHRAIDTPYTHTAIACALNLLPHFHAHQRPSREQNHTHATKILRMQAPLCAARQHPQATSSRLTHPRTGPHPPVSLHDNPPVYPESPEIYVQPAEPVPRNMARLPLRNRSLDSLPWSPWRAYSQCAIMPPRRCFTFPASARPVTISSVHPSPHGSTPPELVTPTARTHRNLTTTYYKFILNFPLDNQAISICKLRIRTNRLNLYRRCAPALNPSGLIPEATPRPLR